MKVIEIVKDAHVPNDQERMKATLVDEKGAPIVIGDGGGYVLPAATPDALGGVKRGSAVSSVSSADASQAASETVTKAEFDALVAVANESKRQLNALLSSLKTSGAIQ